MLKSMTGYGRDRQNLSGKDITVEIKAVNNRFLDVNVKLPRAYMFLEEKVKAYIQSAGISRGKVDVFISIDSPPGLNCSVTLDEEYARGYIDALYKLRDTFGLRDDISVMSVARMHDIFTVTKPEEDLEKDWNDLKTVLECAVDNFNSARLAEGARLHDDIKAKRMYIEELVNVIEEKSESTTKEYEKRLYTKLLNVVGEVGIKVSEDRILTECALFADKVAIDEELVRLRSHFVAFDNYLESSAPVGRDLDFRMQEINRETNTIGSKAQNTEVAHTVVAIKGELEKIREQIQNIE
ncbi:MAG: YicC family protein [Clostridia bacterium]|nr:YicC family protein [Clostridia bacterium]